LEVHFFPASVLQKRGRDPAGFAAWILTHGVEIQPIFLGKNFSRGDHGKDHNRFVFASEADPTDLKFFENE
jgi:hypothetical protein